MPGWGFKKADDVGSGRMGVVDRDPPLGQPWDPHSYSSGTIPKRRALVKSGGGSGGLGQNGGGGGGGDNEPLGCPKCMPWWLLPLSALGVMQFAAWILARK